MAAALASPARARKRTTPPQPPPQPWWGNGKAPHIRWPGVTIEIPAVWSAERGRWEGPDGLHYFDPEAASRARDFFPQILRHHRGQFAGLPFELLDYQDLLIITPLFGWKRASDGMRRFRKVFLAVPKGNGKSPIGSGIGLYLTFADGEEGAEVYSAAADRDQARVVFDTAKVMVAASPHLVRRCQVQKNAIFVPRTTSVYRVLSAVANTKHGFNVHGLLFDEFQAQRNRDLFETLYRGMGKRRQPVLVMMMTAGDDEESIAFEEWEYARRVQSGTIQDDGYLPVIFEASSKEDWRSPEVHERVNPGWGVTVRPDFIASECKAAQDEPRKRNDFMRFHTNRWTNQATAWIAVEEWDACRVEPAPVVAAGAKLFPRSAGLDLSQKIDLTSFVVVEREPLAATEKRPEVEIVDVDEEGKVIRRRLSLNYRIRLHPFFWIPEDTMVRREKEDRVPYSQWREQGLIRVTEGPTVDYDRIFEDITKEIGPRFKLKETQIGYDPAFATQLAGQLQAVGYTVVEVLQNLQQMNEPSQVFEGLIYARRVLHDGHAILRWNVENVGVRQDDAGRIRPVKPKGRAASGRRRIDGVVASLMGLRLLMLQPEIRDENVYNNAEARPHGFLSV